MELTRWQAFGLDRFHCRINDLFDESLGRSRGNATSTRRVWSRRSTLESADSYLVRAELPGINKEDFNLQVKEGVLTLSGERKLEPPASGFEYRNVERFVGKFSRSFYLPQTVKQDEIQATYRDGIVWKYTYLNRSIPKRGRSRQHQLIQLGAAGELQCGRDRSAKRDEEEHLEFVRLVGLGVSVLGLLARQASHRRFAARLGRSAKELTGSGGRRPALGNPKYLGSSERPRSPSSGHRYFCQIGDRCSVND